MLIFNKNTEDVHIKLNIYYDIINKVDKFYQYSSKGPDVLFFLNIT